MGSGCTKCCGKIQDCCRDWCGCCPCKCCKTVQAQVQAQQVVEHRIERKDIPYGSGKLRPGVRTADNTYTSPVLEVCTWRELKRQTTTTEASFTQRVALGGMQTERDNADHHLGPVRGATQRQLEIEEETIFIPVESILSIKHSSEIRKGYTEYNRVVLQKPQHVEPRGCEKVKRWCCRTFCCCCDDSDTRVHPGPEKIVTTIAGEQAERKIVITIEYIRYSNIHTPSHLRVLSVPDQTTFYKENLHQETLKFYLLDSGDFQQTDFDSKRVQASILCRLVTDFKAMIGHYPDEPTFQTLIGKHDGLAIGNPPKENLGQLIGPGQISTHMQLAIQDSHRKDRP